MKVLQTLQGLTVSIESLMVSDVIADLKQLLDGRAAIHWWLGRLTRSIGFFERKP